MCCWLLKAVSTFRSCVSFNNRDRGTHLKVVSFRLECWSCVIMVLDLGAEIYGDSENEYWALYTHCHDTLDSEH